MEPATYNITFRRGNDYATRIIFTVPPYGSDPKNRLYGQGIPADSLGNPGDFFIDALNVQYYGPKVTATWPTPIPLTRIDYSGFGFDAQLRLNEDADTAIDLVVDDTYIATGELVLSLPNTDTTPLTGIYVWDLQLTDLEGLISTPLAGIATVQRDVTRT